MPQLLAARADVPAFARPHHVVWAALAVAAAPPQGARLCLMRNGIADADLAGGARPLEGVLDLALSGNPLLKDASLEPLARLAPHVRRLHLGRTGVVGEGLRVLDAHWPLLEALGLNGTAMSASGFQRLHRAMERRARAVVSTDAERALRAPPLTKAPPADGEAEAAHACFHLDLRDVDALPCLELAQLTESLAKFGKAHPNLFWVRQQWFTGGRPARLENMDGR